MMTAVPLTNSIAASSSSGGTRRKLGATVIGIVEPSRIASVCLLNAVRAVLIEALDRAFPAAGVLWEKYEAAIAAWRTV